MSEILRIKFFDNEAALLITGDILMAAGGVVLGLLIELAQIRDYLIPVCIIFFGFGGYFDYRSIHTFSTKLSQLKDAIKKSQVQLEETIGHAKEIEKKLEESEGRIKNAEEKVFGTGGSIFARSSWAHPIDRTVSEMEGKIKELEHKVKGLEGQINSQRFRRF